MSTIRNKSLSSIKLARLIAQSVSDKKALDIVILEMRRLVNFCDFFVICSGNTERQVKAIADHIEDNFSKLGIVVSVAPGLRTNTWVIFDAGDVVIHIFQKEAREFYNLEYLWRDAKRVTWEEPVGKGQGSKVK